MYSRATNVDVFKKRYDIVKVREVNDYHHARDAYLNIVVGNVFDVKFTTNPLNFIKSGAEYTLNDKIYDQTIKRGDVVAWIPDERGTISTVKRTCSKENMLFTRYSYEQKGGLFDQQILKKGQGQLPTKSSDPHMKGQSSQEWINKYGGYNNVSGAYFCLVEYKNKNKSVRSIEHVPAYISAKIRTDPQELENYLMRVLPTREFSVRIRKIKFNTLFNHNGFPMHISGRSDVRLLFKPAVQLKVNNVHYRYIKRIVRFCAKEKELKRELKISPFDEIDTDKNVELYAVLVGKLSTDLYKAHFSATVKTLNSSRETFADLQVEEQTRTLYEILHIFQCNRINANLEVLKGAKSAGTVRIAKKLSTHDRISITHQSPTGLFEHSVDLLTV